MKCKFYLYLFCRRLQNLLRARVSDGGNYLENGTILHRRSFEIVFAEDHCIEDETRLRRFCIDSRIAIELFEGLAFELRSVLGSCICEFFCAGIMPFNSVLFS